MPVSFPAQGPVDADPESSVLDLPREDLDEVRRIWLFRERQISDVYLAQLHSLLV
jgi:hypothetical protein